MINFGIIFQILAAYLSLSKIGKRFLQKSFKKSRQLNKTIKQPFFLDLRKSLYLIKSFQLCDKIFNLQVQDQLCVELGRDKKAMYPRFVTYGWISLLIWSKMLDAFNLNYDQPAKDSCVLFAFRHREWNDLFDNQGYTFAQLTEVFNYQAVIPKQLTLLRRLIQTQQKLIPPDRFGKYYQLMQRLNDCSFFEHTSDKAERILDQIAPFVARLFIYIMVPEVPLGLEEILKPVGKWLYMLDELTDLEHDRKKNQITYMSMVQDPEKVIWGQFQLCRQQILCLAPNPDDLIKFMESLTLGVINIRRPRLDIEKEFFELN